MGAQTFSNRDYAQMRLWYSGTFVGMLLTYERWGFQLGFGLALQSSHWLLRDSLVPVSTGGYPVSTDFEWTSHPVGVVGDARFQRLIVSRFFLVVRGQTRRYQEEDTPATPRFPSARVDQGNAFLGVGFGVVF